MGKPLLVDLRDRVVAAVERGMSRPQAAARFGVSISSAIRWISLSRRTGDVRPTPGRRQTIGPDRGPRAGDPGRGGGEARYHARRAEDAPGRAQGGGGRLDLVALLRPPEDHAQKSPHMRRSRTVPTS